MIKRWVRRVLNRIGYDAHPYTPSESQWAQLARLLQHEKIDFVVDVGANAGQYAQQLRFLGYAGSILSFEPLRDAHAALIRACASDPRWQAAPRVCLSDREGELTLNVAANGVSTSALQVLPASVQAAPESACIRSEQATATTLDCCFRDHPCLTDNVVFLKLDVQGFEKRVLSGGLQMLERCHGIQLELSLVPLYEDQALLPEMLQFVGTLGFELHALLPGFTNNRTGRSLQVDGVFFRPTANSQQNS